MSKMRELIETDSELRDAYVCNPLFHQVVKHVVANKLDEQECLAILIKTFIKENERLKTQLEAYTMKYGSEEVKV